MTHIMSCVHCTVITNTVVLEKGECRNGRDWISLNNCVRASNRNSRTVVTVISRYYSTIHHIGLEKGIEKHESCKWTS